MAYKVLGIVVWKLTKIIARRELRAALPSRQVGAAAVVTVLVGAIALALARREAGEG